MNVAVWAACRFATGQLIVEGRGKEDFVDHRPVLAEEAVKLLAPKPGSLVVDGTCGGGGHTGALLRSGADVLALDQDPDAVQHVTEQLAQFGQRVTVRQTNFRHLHKVLDGRAWDWHDQWCALDLGVSTPATRKYGARFQLGAQRPARYADGSTE